jgi:phage baseplate assembly protein V
MTLVELEREVRRLRALIENLNVVGRVVDSKVDDTGVFVRVSDPARNIISKWLSVGQASAGGMRTIALPRIGQEVAVHHLGNSIEDGWVDTTLYTPTNPPPEVTNPDQTGGHFDDGSLLGVDPQTGQLLADFKGPINFKTEGAYDLATKGTTTIQAEEAVTVKSGAGLLIEGDSITLKGSLKIEGDIEHDGSMSTTGAHDDRNGLHTRGAELERRFAGLEARLMTLERGVT